MAWLLTTPRQPLNERRRGELLRCLQALWEITALPTPTGLSGNQERVTLYQLVFKSLFINCAENNAPQEVLVILKQGSLKEFPESPFVPCAARGLSGVQ